jgi:hypothetical protein
MRASGWTGAGDHTMSHLKTFTLLVTTEGGSLSLEEAIAAVGARRITVFEGDLLWPIPDGNKDVHAARKEHEALRTPRRAWAELSRDEASKVLRAAYENGGGFVSKLASAWNVADGDNDRKLGEAFGAMLLAHYGDALKDD